MRPPCRTAFFYPVLTFAGFGIPALASLRASQVCQTLLISSYISRCCPTGAASAGVDDAARHLPGKGCSAARMGVGLLGQIDLASRRCSAARMGVGRLVTRHFVPNWQFRRFAQVHQGEFLCHPPSPSWRLFRRSWLAMPSWAGRFAPFRCAHPDGASLRGSFALRGWLRGNDNSRGFI